MLKDFFPVKTAIYLISSMHIIVIKFCSNYAASAV